MESERSPKELIQEVFSSPLIGSTCSQAAEELCMKNNLNFSTLLSPFSRISTEALLRDSSAGVTVSTRGIRLDFFDVDWRPPQTLLARKMLSEAVSSHSSSTDKMRQVPIMNHPPLEVPLTSSWYEEWRDVFFMVQFPSDHEFTRHLVACVIVISSSDVNPVEQAHQLTKKVKMMQNITPPKLPKWISATSDEALNCYVMLHDGSSGDIGKAQQGFENIKATFGENRSFLIQINSQKNHPNPDQPDVWAPFLKRYQKIDSAAENNPESAPKTPQDISQMPTTIQISQSGTETPPTAANLQIIKPEIVHPLSPTQESLPEVAVSQVTLTMSSSANSLTEQTINPNVWLNEPIDLNLPKGAWLTSTDVENIKHFVQDFAIRALIPYIEKTTAQLNDSITNKKSVSKSLLGATKRWFNTNKPGVAPQTAVIYTAESIELQTRKLGDLYFLFGNYNLAFNFYHQAKRDFYADSAWQFYAGALEMAALAAFMQGTASKKTYDYMEEAITTYLNVCKLPQFATRATILSAECLKSGQLYCDAAKQLTRMTSEDADLRSGLLLEQAAYCYLSSQQPFFRKYAFHAVLSGHRYTKAGQRKHAFRMYKQAEQVVSSKGWNLAEDHIQYTISKQAITLKKLEEAVQCLSHLLRPTSLQSTQQQAGFLREYIATQKTLMSQFKRDELMSLALPHLNQNSVRILVTSIAGEKGEQMIPASNIDIMSNFNDNWIWHKLEEMLAQTASKKPMMVFKPVRSLYSGEHPTCEHPLCVLGEPIHIAFVLENPIKPSVTFESITLLWEFKKENGQLFSNRNFFTTGENIADESIISQCTVIDSVAFGEYEKKLIHMTITPKFVGYLRIVGIAGKISSLAEKISIWGKISFDRIYIKNDANQINSDYDRKLEVQILAPAPALQLKITEIPKEVLGGEVFPIDLELTNTGSSEVSDVFIATSSPRDFLLEPKYSKDLPLSIEKDLREVTETLNKDKEARRQYVTRILNSDENETIAPGSTKKLKAFMQAPHKKGRKSLKILVYYNVPENYPKIKYRLLRHEITMNVNDCLSVEATSNIANEETGEVALDIVMKNINQTHHLFSIDMSIGDLYVFCRKFSLNGNKIYFINNSMPLSERSSELASNDSVNIRCILDKRDAKPASKQPAWERLRANISSFCVKVIDELETDVLRMKFASNFLIRSEAKYFPLSQQNITNEDMSNIINANNKHMTLCVNWKAVVSDNGKVVRSALGQHFVKIDHLFEMFSCPVRRENAGFNFNQESYGIYEHEKYLAQLKFSVTELEEWPKIQLQSNINRCFLEICNE